MKGVLGIEISIALFTSGEREGSGEAGYGINKIFLCKCFYGGCRDIIMYSVCSGVVGSIP